ncbi:MAG: hypothetical protein LBB58_07090 [Cellulomonadaceae bacterium]|jgi:hypothetical protein|nr:hypothetical protein [Cellulomonadaceae bacterium]
MDRNPAQGVEMNPTSELIAWGDESGSNQNADPGAYILGAVIARPDIVASARAQMRALLLPGEQKLHWYSSSPKRRTTMAAAVGALDISGIVVVRVGLVSERAERRRRKCLERFIGLLTLMSCERIIMESRGAKDDQRDRQMLDSMRAAKTLLRPIVLDHEPGSVDPMLWAADVLCGATVSARLGESRWLTQIEQGVEVVMVDVRAP